MIKRVVLLLVAVSVIGGLIVYSQWRPELRKVSGFVEADEIRLGSLVGGRVEAVHAEEGHHVAAGKVLITLQPFDLIQRKNKAEAERNARKAEYERLKKGVRPEEIAQAGARVDKLKATLQRLENGPRKWEIGAALARLKAARSRQTLAKDNRERIAAVFAKGATTSDEMDRANRAFEEANALVDEQGQNLSLLKAGTRKELIDEARAALEEARQAAKLMETGYRSEEKDAAKAAWDGAEAALAVVAEQEKELVIIAPVEATIEALDLQPGDLVPAGAPAVSMIQKGKLWVRAYVPESRLYLKQGDEVEVSVDSFPGRRFRGEVTFISRRAEFTPSNVQTPEERSKQVFRIKVTLIEGLDELRPGMPADVWLPASGR